MGLLGTLLGFVVTLFILLLIFRMILDWVSLAGRGPYWTVRARRLAHAGTEPVIAPVRRVMPPIRAGGIGIDLAFTVVFVAALILRGILFSL
ncbi:MULTISPECIES: YggT family protein [unclassified Kutzneria]|uniref:YggT family protein n=1 Tax=unclassified Kutzneria TaxID=2621979 RepID=UPI0003EEC8A8|nr:YggT family protein [Kutzneria sp. 744]EWM19600.1 YGGT family protein [Kutzneria sp. 744]